MERTEKPSISLGFSSPGRVACVGRLRANRTALLAVALVAVAASALACGAPAPAPASPPMATPTAAPTPTATPKPLMLTGEITGMVTYAGDTTPSPAGMVSVYIHTLDSDWHVLPVTQNIVLSDDEHLPISFALSCVGCSINPDLEYVVGATVYDDRHNPLYVNQARHEAVIGDRLVDDLEIAVVPIPSVTGVITFEGPPLPHDAAGELFLRDVSEPDTEPVDIGYFPIEGGSESPIPFNVTYYPAYIEPRGKYELRAQVRPDEGRSCHVLYAASYDVITDGNPSEDINVEIVAVDTPGSGEIAMITGTLTSRTLEEDSRAYTQWQQGRGGPDGPWFVELLDLSNDCVLAKQEIPSWQGFPLPLSFSIPYDPAHVNPDGMYAIEAHLVLWNVDCGSLCGYFGYYSNRWPDKDVTRVLTDGHPSMDVTVNLGFVNGMS